MVIAAIDLRYDHLIHLNKQLCESNLYMIHKVTATGIQRQEYFYSVIFIPVGTIFFPRLFHKKKRSNAADIGCVVTIQVLFNNHQFVGIV